MYLFTYLHYQPTNLLTHLNYLPIHLPNVPTYVSYTYPTIKLVTNLLTYLPSVPTYSLPDLTTLDYYLDHQLTNPHSYLSYLAI